MPGPNTLRAIATRVNATKPDNPAVTLRDLVEVAMLQYAMANIRNSVVAKIAVSRLVIQETNYWVSKLFEIVSYDSDIDINSNDNQIENATQAAFNLFIQ
jgi:hypothetical protein